MQLHCMVDFSSGASFLLNMSYVRINTDKFIRHLLDSHLKMSSECNVTVELYFTFSIAQVGPI